MSCFFEYVESNDGASLLFVLLILWLIGERTIQALPNGRHWGRRAAYLTLLYYVGDRLWSSSMGNADDVLAYLFRGLIAAGYVCSVMWILLPLASFSYHHTLGWAFRSLKTLWRATIQRISASWRCLEDEERQHQEQFAAERLRPEREREAAERERLTREQAARAIQDKRRREDARLKVILLWQTHSRTLATMFPRDQLDALLNAYTSKTEPVEESEHRCQQLTETLQQCLRNAGVSDRPPFQTFTDVAAHFERRGSEIQNLALSQEEKDALLSALNEEKSQAIGHFIQRQR